MIQSVKQDKKVIGDAITFVMLSSPGKLQFVKMNLDEQLTTQIKTTFDQLFVY